MDAAAMPRRRKTGPARARKAALAHLVAMPGETQRWRYLPSPRLRLAGERSVVLIHADGRPFSLTEACAYRDQRLAAVAAGPAAAPGATASERRTLEALETRWRCSAAYAALKPKTQRFYASMIKPWLAYAGPDLVAGLTRDELREEHARQAASRSLNAAGASLRALQALLSYAVDLDWIAANPAAKLGLVTAAVRVRAASPDELARLIATADRLDMAWMGDAIVAGVWTVQRLGELLACDLSRQLLPATIEEPGAPHGWLDFTGVHAQAKTGRDVLVPILPLLAERLGGRQTGLLIRPPQQGRPLTIKSFNTAWLKVRRAAGVEDLQFRDLRDTGITRLYEAGADPSRIATGSGHTDQTVHQMMRHYRANSRAVAGEVGVQLAAWAERKGVRW